MHKIALQAHELQILLTDDRLLGRNVEIVKVAGALRAMLENEPVVLEDRAKLEARKMLKWGLRVV